jgi:hypothetical protein
MRPTRLELDLGNLVMQVLRMPVPPGVARRLAERIPVRWFNGEPYVREEECKHGEATTKWTKKDGRNVAETTCNYCGMQLDWDDRFGKGA